MLKIGILAVQGDFAEHKLMLTNLDIDAVEIRLPEQLEDIDGLIIPGGESTTIAQLLDILISKILSLQKLNLACQSGALVPA